MIKYGKYKSSGIEWLDIIPKHWNVGKLKNVSDLVISSIDKHILDDERRVLVCNYTDVYYNEFISNKLELRVGSCSDDEYNKFQLNKGDVIITKDSESPSDIGVPSLVVDELENVVCGYHLSIIKPKDTIMLGGFLFRQLQTKRIRNYYEVCSNGITRFGLGKSSVLDTPLIIPPLSEQQQIVQFLDEKTGLIDKLISTKERKIDLLKQQRTSLINEVITKGLDPNVKMKDSGVEWIGEIPEHWVLVNLRHYYKKIGSGVTPRGGSETYVDNGVIFIRSQNVHFDGLRLDEVVRISEDVNNEMSSSKVKLFDVLLNITGGSIGRCCVVDLDEEMNVNQHVCIIRPKESLSSYFLNYFLKSTIGQTFIEFYITGGNREGLNIDSIKCFQIPFTSIEEQHQIVEYLDIQTKEIDNLISMENKKIDLLKEYRQSLISDVVTGKIDVRVSTN